MSIAGTTSEIVPENISYPVAELEAHGERGLAPPAADLFSSVLEEMPLNEPEPLHRAVSAESDPGSWRNPPFFVL